MATETILAIAASVRRRDMTVALDLAFGAGITALVGPSGAGKTTLLRLVAGLTRPDSGIIQLGDTLLDDVARRYHLPPGRRGVGLVFQEYALFPHLSVAENVAYGLRARRASGTERRRRVGDMLERLGIGALAAEYPNRLSGGQRQRVALARALVLEPRALLLDEPLAALDARTRGAVRSELRAMLAGLPIPTLLVTHDYADAVVFRERIVIMDGGRVVQDGSHASLLAHPRSRFVADFTGVNYYEGVLETAPSHSEGVLETAPGRVGGASGLAAVRLGADSRVFVASEGRNPGPVSLALRPWDVILSRQLPVGSARNVLPGRVRDVTPLGGRARVVLAIGGSDALQLTAEITHDALDGLDVREGEALYASFKATAVTVGTL